MRLVRLCVLFLAIICYQGEHLSIQASGAIKKIVGRGNKGGSFQLEAESSELSFPVNGRCESVGNYVAEKKKVVKYFTEFFKCIKDQRSIQYQSLHDKYAKISEKCAKYGHKASELTKVQSLNCIFCYKEILKSLKDKHPEVKQVVETDEDESFANAFIITIYLEKFLRQKLTIITKHVISTNWFMAYSSSREFCGTLVIVYELWNRVIRDFFWAYLIVVSDNYLSRFPVEFRKLNIPIYFYDLNN